ncbi:MAG: exodeoxyribonuclease V subunit gamma [Gammaproteobacteria bacterium]|nr:exodeoxyribonuclease V subunit gamma [Gammaproteobacteria bacterium]
MYRPEWIRAWQRGEASHWQAQVWRKLVASGVGRHWVDAVDAFERGVRAERTAAPVQRELFDSPIRELKERNTNSYEGQLKENLTRVTTKVTPTRVSFFGVDSLSPSYLSVLRMAAADHDIHLFQLSPCREFWADTRSRRELRRGTEPAPYVSEGNELLAAWGRGARDMQALLADDLGLGAPDETYSEPATSGRLARVQQDILDLRLSTEATAPDVPKDDSIQIHVCHSATREAEVLHDRLLGLFDAHEDIQPADVLVLTPNMDEYAPAIEAVFDSSGTIPFNIGRLRRRDGAAVRAFLDLLALPGSRYPVSFVMAPLRASSVASRFNIRETDLPEIRGWIANAGIHWGVGKHDVPSSSRHTWQHGLNRLLLGYALAGSADRFGDFASCDLDRFGNDGPDRYERLGHFARYAELAFGLSAMAEEILTPSEWAQRLREAVLKPFFATEHLMPEVAREADTVARLIEDLEEEWQIAGIDGAIAFSVVREALYELGAASSRAVARLADGVTVAPLGAGQVFPAKVVCTVGMNDGAFPRHHAPPSFDIVAADSRRPGDRDLRDEDRLAFLTALLSARKAFLVTYTGRELREDSNIPPSVVVSELVDYLTRRFADDKVALRHPLQPFNRKYFDAAEEPITGSHSSEVHFSYSAPMALAAAAVRHRAAATVAEQRLHGTLPPPERIEGEVELTELIRFAAHPAKHFAQTRLGLRLEIEDEDPAKDEEPLELNYLEQWQLKDGLFDLLREELGEEDAEWLVRARGLLPPGNLGAVEHRRGAVQVATLRQALVPYAENQDAPATLVDIDVQGIRVTGEVAGFLSSPASLLWWRIGRIREKDRIEVWLRLLALTCATGTRITAHVVGVTNAAQEETFAGPEPGEAARMLGNWIDAWRDGTSAPLPLFPKASWAWAETQDANKAWGAWADGNWPESEDHYLRLLCPQGPETEGFQNLADTLLGPLAESLA